MKSDPFVIVLLLITIWIVHSYINDGAVYYAVSDLKPVKSNVDGRHYGVSEYFNSQHQEAADKLAKMNDAIISFIQYMRNKYIWNTLPSDNPGIKIRQILTERMRLRYNPDRLVENVPVGMDETSYTLNKGQRVSACVRDNSLENESRIEKDAKVQTDDAYIFVALHELTHIATNVKDHPPEFWSLFRLILNEATDAGIFSGVNYSKYPVITCGLKLQYSPQYDPRMSEDILYDAIDRI